METKINDIAYDDGGFSLDELLEWLTSVSKKPTDAEPKSKNKSEK